MIVRSIDMRFRFAPITHGSKAIETAKSGMFWHPAIAFDFATQRAKAATDPQLQMNVDRSLSFLPFSLSRVSKWDDQGTGIQEQRY